MPTLVKDDISRLLDRLLLEPDEGAAVCVVGRHQDAALVEVMYGSVLFGPAELTANSWPEWAELNNHGPNAQLAKIIESEPCRESPWRAFTTVVDGWCFTRWNVGPNATERAHLVTWLADLLSGKDVLGGPEGQLQLRGSARPARSLIRTFPLLASPASLLCLQAWRPVTGYHFPLEPASDKSPPPSVWDIDGRRLSSAPLFLLGLPVSDTPLCSVAFDPKSGPTPGLLVGRVERSAWLSDVRALPNKGTLSLSLGIDESRVSLADLELELEEYESGDLVSARRLRLGDIRLPDRALLANEFVTIELPTLGLGLHRQIRLFDRDGLLVDATDRTPFVEEVTVRIDLDTSPGPSVIVGGVSSVALTERLERADHAEEEYAKLLEDGLQGRVIDDATTGLSHLASTLSRARDYLDVLDPYFGWDPADWQILANVLVPVRVLTGHGRGGRSGSLLQKVVAPPPTVTSSVAVEVRSWRSGTPRWHDRIYLWAGGGASVGTSPSGIGRRVVRMDRVNRAEATGWQKLFDTWWASPSARPI